LAQEQERLELGQKERDRLKVLHEVEGGHLTQQQGAVQTRMSERGFRKLLARYRKKGDAGVVHGLRGRKSNRSLDGKIGRKALKLVQKEYSDFGPTLASEYLSQEHQVDISRETLRKLLIQAGLWKAKQRKVKQVHVWRQRRSCRGELVQWDTSVHAWLEDRGPERMYLVALIDDATSTLFARFVTADSTEEHMRVLRSYLECWGRPQAVYTDKASLFQPTLAPGWKGDEPGDKSETQLGRALRELGIEWIAAHSPQAKGRVERCFGTLQDRLVKALRKGKVKTLEQANEYLKKEFLPMWNKRFTSKPANEADAHRPIPGSQDLDSLLSLTEVRGVASDYTISWRGKRWQIPKAAVRAGLRGSRIRIEQRLNGKMTARVGEAFVELEACEHRRVQPLAETKPAKKKHIPGPGQSRWMDNFHLKGIAANQSAHGTRTAISARLRSPSGLPTPG
jgi:transposase InsO family protein